jgi:hypothetical protein
MKYILLDIDGVLTTDKQMYMNAAKFQAKNEWAKELNVLYPFDPDCVIIFNEILELTNAEIILSSDWKLFWDLEKLHTIFEKNGVIKSPIDVTKDFMVSRDAWVGLEKNRASQLAEYIERKKLEDYIIIDDLNVKKYMDPKHDDSIILTRSAEGLKQSMVKYKILKKFGVLNS